MVQAVRKIGYKVCTCISRLGLGHLRTRIANFTSILPVSAKIAIFRNFVPFSMHKHSKNEHEIHASGISARDDLGIPLRCNELKVVEFSLSNILVEMIRIEKLDITKNVRHLKCEASHCVREDK